MFFRGFKGLPPDQELEFGIELLLRSAPISIPPYKMMLVELKELKTQLQDLVDKGFILPSVSPWGCSSVVCKEKGWNHEIVYRLLVTE